MGPFFNFFYFFLKDQSPQNTYSNVTYGPFCISSTVHYVGKQGVPSERSPQAVATGEKIFLSTVFQVFSLPISNNPKHAFPRLHNQCVWLDLSAACPHSSALCPSMNTCSSSHC